MIVQLALQLANEQQAILKGWWDQRERNREIHKRTDMAAEYFPSSDPVKLGSTGNPLARTRPPVIGWFEPSDFVLTTAPNVFWWLNLFVALGGIVIAVARAVER